MDIVGKIPRTRYLYRRTAAMVVRLVEFEGS